MIEDSLEQQKDRDEVTTILATPHLRDFYLAMCQHLKASVKAIETLSSGLIEGSPGTRNKLFSMIQSSKRSGKSMNERMQVGSLSAEAVEKTIKQFPFPASDLVSSTVGFLLTMKESREGAMAAVRVSLFGSLCDSNMMTGRLS